MGTFNKVFGRVQFYNRASEYFETIDSLMESLYKQQTDKGLIEYIVVYGTTHDSKLYRAVFDFSSFSLEDIKMDDIQLHNKKFQKYLGEILLDQKMITKEQLEQALIEQSKSAVEERLGEVFARLGYLKNEEIINALIKQIGLKKED